MTPVGSYDPDADDRVTGLQKARPKGKTDLQRSALLATGHRTQQGEAGLFGSNDQKKRFRAIEDRALGADEESRMIAAWMRHNIKLAADANKFMTIRSMWWLLAAMENEDRMIDWISANRQRVLKEEHEFVKDMFDRT